MAVSAKQMLQMDGPPQDFIGGHLMSFRRDVLEFVMNNLRQYGDLVPLKILNLDAYQVNHPDLIAEVLSKNYTTWRKSYVYKYVMGDYIGNGLLISDGDFWRRQRKLIQPAFHTQRIQAYADTMVDYTQRMLDDWPSGETRDLSEEMMHLTLMIVGKTLFNSDLHKASNQVAQAVHDMIYDVSSESRAIIRLPKWIPTPLRMRKKRTNRSLDAVVLPMIEARRSSGEDTGDLLSILLLAKDENGEGMDDQQVRDEAVTLVLAGHETTANALTWTLYLLNQHPEIEQKLLSEIQTVLGERLPKLEDVRDLTYSEKVLKESMRLYPPAWNIGRMPAEDTVLAGMAIKQYSPILIPIYAVHRDERWYPEPEKFDPERWTAANEAKIPRYAYMPFGGGPRICIGNAFAMMEATLILVSVLQKFRLRLVPNHPVVPEPTVTMRPKYGMKMVIEKR
jgi:cytochrome P450